MKKLKKFLLMFFAILAFNITGCKENVEVDVTPPAEVKNLTATAEEGKIVLTWEDPSDSDLLGIKVYNGKEQTSRAVSLENGILVGKGIQKCEIGNLEDGKTYTFKVSAVDKNLNESAVKTTTPVTFKVLVVEKEVAVYKYVCPKDKKEFATAEEAAICCGVQTVEKEVTVYKYVCPKDKKEFATTQEAANCCGVQIEYVDKEVEKIVKKYVCPRDGKEFDTAEEAKECCGPVVEEKLVYTTAVKAGTYTIYHFQQKTSGGKAFEDYSLYATENSKNVAENSMLDDLKKNYAGFTAKALAQNESALYVFYDRNIIAIKYLINPGDDEPYAIKTGLYDTEIEAVSNPTKENKSGYHFNYWTLDGDTKVTPVTICPASDVVYIANWHQIKNYTINYSSELGTAPEAKTIECHTPLTAEYLPELEEIDNGGFKYWKNAITDSKVLEGQILSLNTSLVAVWFTDTFNWYVTPVDAESGEVATVASKYIYFGVFPKTVLPENSAVTVDETEKKIKGANTYYKGNDGNYYAKVTENCYGSSGYTYSDGTTVKQSGAASTRYFKVEPIKWKVLTTDYNGTGRALLLAEDILTANVPYYVSIKNRTIGGSTVYANNYKYSTIRAYLNGAYESNDTQTKTYEGKGFLQTAFTSNARLLIADTVVNNAKETTGYDESTYAEEYACENTEDKIFLLSASEVINSDYGFAAAYTSRGQRSARIRVTTDYAKANFADQSTTDGYGYFWWLRSPDCNHSGAARSVGLDGIASYYGTYVYAMDYGVVPALSISLQ